MKAVRRPAVLLLPALLIACLLISAAPAFAGEERIVGDVVVEEGETAEEASTLWGDVTVHGKVREDVETGFGNVQVEGPVGGDVGTGSGDVTVAAPVGGDVDVGHGDVVLMKEATVEGDVSYNNGSLDSEPEAVVGGMQTAGMVSDPDDDAPFAALFGAVGWTVATLGLVAAAVLLAVVAPGPLRASARSLEAAPGRSLALGAGSVPAAVVVTVLLALLGVVGALLLLLLWPAYLALLLFGALVAAYALGRRVVLVTGRYRAGDAFAAAVGALLVSVANLIPFLGQLVLIAAALLGTGAIVSALLARRASATRPRRTAYDATASSYEEYLEGRRDA